MNHEEADDLWNSYQSALKEYGQHFQDGLIEEKQFKDFVNGSILALNAWGTKINNIMDGLVGEIPYSSELAEFQTYLQEFTGTIQNEREKLQFFLENPDVYQLIPDFTVQEMENLKLFRYLREENKLES